MNRNNLDNTKMSRVLPRFTKTLSKKTIRIGKYKNFGPKKNTRRLRNIYGKGFALMTKQRRIRAKYILNCNKRPAGIYGKKIQNSETTKMPQLVTGKKNVDLASQIRAMEQIFDRVAAQFDSDDEADEDDGSDLFNLGGSEEDFAAFRGYSPLFFQSSWEDSDDDEKDPDVNPNPE